MKFDLSLWLCCLPALLLAVATAIALGRAPASPGEHTGGVLLADDAEELNCFARLGLLDDKPDGRIDLRDRCDDS